MDTRFKAISFLAIAAAAILTYGHTLHAPWYLDDFSGIVTNETVADLERALRGLFHSRGFAYLTFALENAAFGMQVESAHVVNITIHAISAVLVLLILLEFFPGRRDLAFIGAMVFLLHPVQTQAVTYLVQRMASMAGMFMLLSLYLYLQARKLADKGVSLSAPRHAAPYALALLAGLLGAYTKQTAVVLPALFLVAHFTVLGNGSRRTVLYVAPFLLVSLAATLSSTDALRIYHNLHMYALEGESPGEVVFQADAPGLRLRYMLTQGKVFWIYQKLILWPAKQALDYSYPYVRLAFDWKVLAGLVGVALVVGLSWWGRLRRPMVAFGVLWFCVAISLESTVLPLAALYEHRLYLALLGPIAIALDVASRADNRRIVWAVSLVVLLALGVQTYKRNAQWNSPALIWSGSLAQAPYNDRALRWLATSYLDASSPRQAASLLEADLNKVQSDKVLAVLHGRALFALGRVEDAMENFRVAMQIEPKIKELDFHKGLLALGQGQHELAIAHFEVAKEANYYDFRPVLYLGIAKEAQGKYDEAASIYMDVIERPLDASIAMEINDTMRLQGMARKRLPVVQGLLAPRVDELKQAVALNPMDLNAQARLAITLDQWGFDDEAIVQYQRLISMGGERWEIHLNLGNTYKKRKLFDQAILSYEEALKLAPDNPTVLGKLGALMQMRGRYADAQGLLARSVELDPSDKSNYIQLAKNYYILGRFDESRQAFESIKARFPDIADMADQYLKMF